MNGPNQKGIAIAIPFFSPGAALTSGANGDGASDGANPSAGDANPSAGDASPSDGDASPSDGDASGRAPSAPARA